VPDMHIDDNRHHLQLDHGRRVGHVPATKGMASRQSTIDPGTTRAELRGNTADYSAVVSIARNGATSDFMIQPEAKERMS
jgi:hypothetical protein